MSTIDSLVVELGFKLNDPEKPSRFLASIRAGIDQIRARATTARSIMSGLGDSFRQGMREEWARQDAARRVPPGAAPNAPAGGSGAPEAKQAIDVVKLLRTAVTGLLGLSVVNWARNSIHELIEMGDQLGVLSAELGISTDAIQSLQYAAGRADVEFGAVVGGLRFLQRTVTGAGLGSKEAAKSLSLLGLSAAELGKLDAQERIATIADALVNIKDPGERAGIAMRVLGRSAGQLLPLLGQGGAAIRAMGDEFKELGGGLSTDMLEAIGAVDESIDKMRVTWTTARGAILTLVLPALQATIETLRTVSIWLVKANKSMQLVQFVGIAGLLAVLPRLVRGIQALTRAQAVAMARMVVWGLAIAAVAIVVQDLINLFRGGRSAIAEWVDQFAGLGRVDGWVRNIKAGWEAMADLQFPGIQDVLEAMQKLVLQTKLMPEMQGKIEGLKAGLTTLREQRKGATGTQAAALDERIGAESARLKVYEDEMFGVRGLRTVGRGLDARAQRSGEQTTGSLSRTERNAAAAAAAPSAPVTANITVNAPQAGASAQDIAKHVDQAGRRAARNIAAAAGRGSSAAP